ncbi:hypothetical protein [Amycolatopsis taiwanensis]|uniref:hypothetical protein n=1 Tax=Amycolatopsis taiwanensis TaxID=342230 RepID=UPI000482A368|nr:hypothetical protein [Amycolatopsis taiwanensis]
MTSRDVKTLMAADDSELEPFERFQLNIVRMFDELEAQRADQRRERGRRMAEYRRLAGEIGETWRVKPQKVTAVLLTEDNIEQAAALVLSTGVDVEGSPDTHRPRSFWITQGDGELVAVVGQYLVRTNAGRWKVYERHEFEADHMRKVEP